MTQIDTKQTTVNLWINGSEWEGSGGVMDAIDPSTGQKIAKVLTASQNDLNHSVEAAREAFEHWRQISVEERAHLLKQWSRVIRDHASDLIRWEVMDSGKTIKHATFIDVPTCAEIFEFFAEKGPHMLMPRRVETTQPVHSTLLRQPHGVVAAFLPWNYPLIIAAWKIAPALLAGNTIVVKPSPWACVSVLKLAALSQKAGLPDGVVNAVIPSDDTMAQGLAEHAFVDMISFTGSFDNGRKIMQTAAQRVKPLILELSDNAPAIVFDDCDEDMVIGALTAAAFLNEGQMCTGMTRLLLSKDRGPDFLQLWLDKIKHLKIGPASDYTTDIGPLIHQQHVQSLLKRITQACDEGARILTGGKIPEGLPAQGAYLEPTVLEMPEGHPLLKEELFGPVVCVTYYDDEKHAVQLANDSPFGLAATVWTKDEKRARRVAEALHCGTVWINTYGMFVLEAPFGGWKQSGFGVELGPEGVWAYTRVKHVCQDDSPSGRPLVSQWFA